MFAEERQKEILSILGEYDYATVEYLAAKIHISPSSIRRDLKALEGKGLVKRSYGGVELLGSLNRITPFSIRSHKNFEKKKSIAKKALDFIHNDDVLFIDGSTTAYLMAGYLKSFPGIKVFTNSISTMNLLCERQIKVYCTGGVVYDDNHSVLVGPFAENMISQIHVDILFFSSQAISSDGIIYDCSEQETKIRKMMIQHATKRVLLCDSSKLNRVSIFKLCDISDVDYVVCDVPMQDYLSKKCDGLVCLCP